MKEVRQMKLNVLAIILFTRHDRQVSRKLNTTY